MRDTPRSTRQSVLVAVHFGLECRGKLLPHALLNAVLSFHAPADSPAAAGVSSDMPVAMSDRGLYQISWAMPYHQARSGQYKLTERSSLWRSPCCLPLPPPCR
jgi:hypothetical protein